jgi:AmmeMemoRadiSam system protein A
MALREPRAVFVTLTLDQVLRGCLGTFESGCALAINVAHYAYAAAFNDPRFSPIIAEELPLLQIHLSILSPLEDMAFASEEDLLRQIRPGQDGLLLEEGGHRGTFLPSVWEDLPEPGEFLRRLKMKAGLPPHYWSPHIRLRRYTATYIE